MRLALVAVFAVASVLGVQALTCGKGEPCPEGQCCMLMPGMRYGLPSCAPLVASGDPCRPNNQPQNYSLSAGPNQEASLYTGVYRAVCPCHPCLKCNDGICG